MLGDISYHKATLQSESKHCIHIVFTFTFRVQKTSASCEKVVGPKHCVSNILGIKYVKRNY